MKMDYTPSYETDIIIKIVIPKDHETSIKSLIEEQTKTFNSFFRNNCRIL